MRFLDFGNSPGCAALVLCAFLAFAFVSSTPYLPTKAPANACFNRIPDIGYLVGTSKIDHSCE